jgi:hypothetical protein
MKFGNLQLLVLIFLLSPLVLWCQGQRTPQTAVEPTAPAQPLSPQDNGQTDSNVIPAPVAGTVLDTNGRNPVQQDQYTGQLSGGRTLGVGGARDLLDLSLFVGQYGEKGVTLSSASAIVGSTNVGGMLNLNRSWSNYRTSVFYSGGYSLTDGQAITNPGSFGVLSVNQEMSFGRWALIFSDAFSASPQATFGGELTGGPGNLQQFTPETGSATGTLNSTLVPGQVILTGQALRINNITLGELDYELSHRSAVTFSGSYGLLHFFSPGYVDSQQVLAQTGYNYALSARNTIAFTASYGRFDFSGNNVRTDFETLNMAFGRRVTGRLAFQLAGGPQRLQSYRVTPSVRPKLTWNLNATLNYVRLGTTYSLAYAHGVTAGSGVLSGANSDTFTVMLGRNLLRRWSTGANAGYSTSTSIVSVGTTGNFKGWYGGANAARELGRHYSVGLNYGLQRQYQNGAVCLVANCGSSHLLQTFGINFSWQMTPVRIN